MKKLTIQFAGIGLQDETTVQGFETSSDLLNAIANCADGGTYAIKNVNEPLFDYETGTMWEVADETEKDKLKAEIEKSNKNWANLCDWLGNEIANDEDEAEIYRNVLERVNQIQHYQPKWSVCASIKRIAELEAKLEEKEQTIKEINKAFVESVLDWKKLVKDKTKQVCEEIKYTITLDSTDNGYLDQQVDIYNLYEILDQIKRGEK